MNGSFDLATTDDAFLGGRLRLLQPVRGYRAAIDPILLAAACRAGPGDKVVDLGCGVGAAMLCLASRSAGIFFTGVEVNGAAASLARLNIERNGFSASGRIVEADVADSATLADEAGTFDRAIMNPPYLPKGRGTISPDAGKALAHVESSADLAAFISCAGRLLRHGGELLVVHRADRVDEVEALLGPMFGAVAVLPLAPRAEEPPRRALMRSTCGADPGPRRTLPPFVLHEASGVYTPAADRVLRGEALAF